MRRSRFNECGLAGAKPLPTRRWYDEPRISRNYTNGSCWRKAPACRTLTVNGIGLDEVMKYAKRLPCSPTVRLPFAYCSPSYRLSYCSFSMGWQPKIQAISNCSKLNFNLDFEASRLRGFEMSCIPATSMPRFQYVNWFCSPTYQTWTTYFLFQHTNKHEKRRAFRPSFPCFC